jgi:hypothetical protein
MRGRLPDTAKDLESPFLDGEVLTAEPRRDAGPRLARLAQHNPFEELLFFPGGRAAPGSGGGSTPVLSRPDFWPDVVYIAKGPRDSFLNSARAFHKLWGFKPVEFESFEGLIGLIAKAKNPEQRIRVVSHAWDGFNIPLFHGSPAGFTITQRQIEALNAGDGALMDELLGRLVDLDATTDKGYVAWNALLVHLESSSPDALKPFGLSSKTKPTGDRELLLRRCAELVAVASADPVFKNALRKSIAAAQVRLKRSKPEADALAASVTSSRFTFSMSPVTEDMVKRLRAAVAALDRRAFRTTLKDTRTKLTGKWLDFRGCRIGHQPKYLEALAILLGTDGCTAPDWWSGYPGEAPLRDQQVRSTASFKSIVGTSAAAARSWGAKPPRMPTLATHLKAATGSRANPQMIFVAPEPEFRDHIIEVKKP